MLWDTDRNDIDRRSSLCTAELRQEEDTTDIRGSGADCAAVDEGSILTHDFALRVDVMNK